MIDVPQSSLDEEACRAKNAKIKIKSSAARRRWPALPCAAGRRGMFDIVRCVYPAPGFVTAAVRGPAAILREQTADAGERAPQCLAT